MIGRRAVMSLIQFMHPPGWLGWNVIHRKFARLWGVGTYNAQLEPYDD
jgi:hypothetical protein